jgi:hypothetical protein
MYSASGILKTEYFTALKSVLPGVAVFKNYVPNQLETDSYVLISNVQQTDESVISKNNVKAFVTIGIYTGAVTENDGQTVDTIADAIFSLYPTPQSYPQLPGYQVCSIGLESDQELTVSLDNGMVFMNRTIIFSHILNKLN